MISISSTHVSPRCASAYTRAVAPGSGCVGAGGMERSSEAWVDTIGSDSSCSSMRMGAVKFTCFGVRTNPRWGCCYAHKLWIVLRDSRANRSRSDWGRFRINVSMVAVKRHLMKACLIFCCWHSQSVRELSAQAYKHHTCLDMMQEINSSHQDKLQCLFQIGVVWYRVGQGYVRLLRQWCRHCGGGVAFTGQTSGAGAPAATSSATDPRIASLR